MGDNGATALVQECQSDISRFIQFHISFVSSLSHFSVIHCCHFFNRVLPQLTDIESAGAQDLECCVCLGMFGRGGDDEYLVTVTFDS